MIETTMVKVMRSALRFLWTLPTNLIGHGVGLAITRARPVRVGSDAAPGWLYVLPPRKGFGAIALGDAVISAPELVRGEGGRMVLLHELSHVRQHSWLGPLYLPLHALAQLLSLALSTVRPTAGTSRIHAYNPLEQHFLCVPYHEICRPAQRSERIERLFSWFGV
ncbi:MAG TPA: hypothetical protein VFR10_10835 [bacterium]|nr:hypothetical protein [bacterium]